MSVSRHFETVVSMAKPGALATRSSLARLFVGRLVCCVETKSQILFDGDRRGGALLDSLEWPPEGGGLAGGMLDWPPIAFRLITSTPEIFLPVKSFTVFGARLCGGGAAAISNLPADIGGVDRQGI